MVEDNPADAELIRECFDEYRIEGELLVVTDGERAIEFIETLENGQMQVPDLVILDLNLPKKRGTDVLTVIRSIPRLRHAPVVILTSSDEQKDKDETARLGVSRYVMKPSHLGDFLRIGITFREVLGIGLH